MERACQRLAQAPGRLGDFLIRDAGDREPECRPARGRREERPPGRHFHPAAQQALVERHLADAPVRHRQPQRVATGHVNTYKGQPASWEDTRWTGVLEKRDGRWVIVQQHFSFATEE
ncbi:MAG: nuclear transport factor 2 family protein [Acidobacteriota bacterium]